MAYNVSSVSEVSRRGIWAKAIAEARYALLYAVPLLDRLNLLSQQFDVFKET
jgi:hypothetical protein